MLFEEPAPRLSGEQWGRGIQKGRLERARARSFWRLVTGGPTSLAITKRKI
jgi:hypothetical protein